MNRGRNRNESIDPREKPRFLLLAELFRKCFRLPEHSRYPQFHPANTEQPSPYPNYQTHHRHDDGDDDARVRGSHIPHRDDGGGDGRVRGSRIPHRDDGGGARDRGSRIPHRDDDGGARDRGSRIPHRDDDDDGGDRVRGSHIPHRGNDGAHGRGRKWDTSPHSNDLNPAATYGYPP